MTSTSTEERDGQQNVSGILVPALFALCFYLTLDGTMLDIVSALMHRVSLAGVMARMRITFNPLPRRT